MKVNPLGKSGLRVSEIGFGCMLLGPDHKENERLLHRAVELGINFFDTADLYDRGRNEESVGRAFKGMRQEVVIATKVGNRWREDGSGWDWDPSPDYIKRAVGESLRRLQTDYLDLYQLHGGTLDDPVDDVIATFEDLKRQGIIRAFGISSVRPSVIREWGRRSELASVMTQYSLLDRRPEEETLDFLHRHGVSVIARGPVAKGILSDAGEEKVAGGFLDHALQTLWEARAALQSLAAPLRGMAQLALRYSLSHPAVATVIPGASCVEQLEENARAAYTTLSEEELQVLRSRVKATTYTQHR